MHLPTRGGAMSKEDREAIAFVEAVQRAYPRLAHLLLHVKNERASAAVNPGAAAGQLKKQRRMGVRKGTADYFWAHGFLSRGRGLWLELKATGGSVKPEQIQFLRDMAGQGYAVAVAWGSVGALKAIREYESDNMAEYGLQAFTEREHGPLEDFTLTGTRRKRGTGGQSKIQTVDMGPPAAATPAVPAVPRKRRARGIAGGALAGM